MTTDDLRSFWALSDLEGSPAAPESLRRMNTPDYPTPSQRKTLWAALTAVSTVTIGAVFVGLIYLTSYVLAFLQPILIPFAVAGVMAYLLDPVVSRIVSWGTSRQRAVLAVFTIVTLALVGILFWIIPAIWTQTANLIHRIPAYREKIEVKVQDFNSWGHKMEEKYGIRFLPQLPDEKSLTALAEATATPPPAIPKPGTATVLDPDTLATADSDALPRMRPGTSESGIPFDLSGDWLREALPAITRNTWTFIRTSIGGFLGVFGFLFSMIFVPIYLYYFLIESKTISESWGDYLPLRASAFKDEVVSTLSEINGYLIAFFRGQLLVSLINGTATGLGLVIVGLDFGLLIGLLLCVLGIVPYLGIALCWVPAVIIALVQGGAGTWIPGEPWWVFPLVVTLIFVVVQQIDGLFITPKIVGESVGLHPMTVIMSMFAWTLLMGGLLGAILAVPMTATVKVLLRRFVWERRFMAETRLATEETAAEFQARAPLLESESVL